MYVYTCMNIYKYTHIYILYVYYVKVSSEDCVAVVN